MSPLTLTILAIFLLFSVPLILLDRKRAQYHTKFMHGIQTYLRSNVSSSTSVIVHAEVSTRKLNAFATHLQGFDSARLQLVVLYTPKQRAKVRALQRKFSGKLKISLVLNKDEKNMQRALKRQITGDYIYEATLETRFDRKFFDYISLEFLNPHTEALAIDRTSQLDNRLTSAAAVWTNVLASVGRRIGLTKAALVVYRKKDFFAKERPTSLSESRAQVVAPLGPGVAKFGRIAGLLSLSIVAIAAFAAYSIFPITWLYVPIALYLGLLLILIVNLPRLPHSSSEKAVLALVLPFWPVLAVFANTK